MGKQTIVREKGNLRLSGISGEDILALLKSKHCKDAIVPECKNGETWGARDLLKLDAWVLLRTYSPLTTIGYEIKTSRQDFEQDQKWTSYLDLCHAFYFVCPAGLIRATDLPQRVGIIWASKDRLFTKRKAERVEPDIEKLNRLLVYVVMSRSQIVANMFEVNKEQQVDRLKEIRELTERAVERKELAEFVRGHIRDIYGQITSKDRTFKNRESDIERFRIALEKLGITWNPEESIWMETTRVENEINALRKGIDERTLWSMKAVGKTLIETANTIEGIKISQEKST